MAMTTKRTAARLHLLTAREVHAAKDGDYSDGGGLMLRVRTGSCSWVFRFTAPSGRRREMGLGVVRRGSVAQAGESLTSARTLAHDARGLLQRDVDPIEDRDRVRGEAQQADDAKKADKARERRTLARCARDYHERVIERTRTTKHAAQWIASLENHVPPALWNAPIDSVDAPSLLRALTAIKPHDRARNLSEDHELAETARRLRQRLESVFEDAQFHGWCTSNPAAAIRRKMREVVPAKSSGQLAALPYKEAPAFMWRLRDAQGIAARCLELALLTAARTSEALTAEWAEFDLDLGTWTIPAAKMKANEEHVVYLSDRALAIVKGQAGLHGSLLFPSTMRPDQPLSNMAMLAVLDRLGMRDRTTVHGLCRATFSTWANETAAARPDVIEAALAHKEADKVRSAYNRAQFAEERRALLQAWSEYLAQPAAQVIPIGQAA